MTKGQVFTGLAGAAAMAGATQGYGAVVNVTLPANITGAAPTTAGTQTNRSIDLNGDGTRDLYIRYVSQAYTGGNLLRSLIYVGTAASAGASVGSYIAGSTRNLGYAFSLKAGYVVGAASGFYQATGYLNSVVTNYKGTNYGFTNYLGQAGVPENLGFRFTTSTGQVDYGYIRLETDPYVSAANPGGIKFLGLAYENTGASITIPNATNVPEPGSLAALALGAAGCVGIGLKRRRAAAAAAKAE